MKQEQYGLGHREHYIREMGDLRAELLNLKHCQITFLTFSVTATGILLGFSTVLGSHSPIILGIVFLFPLVFLLPAWWIFFDKATTITRIVGYYRILEKLLLDRDYSAPNFAGWETNLGNFRLLQNSSRLRCPKDHICPSWRPKLYKVLRSKTGHPYWLICYFIFFALSGLCIAVSFTLAVLFHNWLFLAIAIAATIVFAASAFWNLKMVHKLIYGHSQYNCNECFWETVLGVPEAKRAYKVRTNANL